MPDFLIVEALFYWTANLVPNRGKLVEKVHVRREKVSLAADGMWILLPHCERLSIATTILNPSQYFSIFTVLVLSG